MELQVYGMYVKFAYIDKSVYCAISICIADKDTGMEMEAAVIEIGQDEEPYIQSIYINEEALDYFDYDYFAKLSYWIGNFWVGIQYELNNCPEEIRVIDQREIQMENNKYKEKNNVVLVKRVIPVDEEENMWNCQEKCSHINSLNFL